jgi:deazaflavin-dependent oxidoreductase (nitroreductase family)
MSEYDDWNNKVIAEFRANEGRVGGQFEGAPLLLLHTTGAKSGADRVNPMMYLEQDGHVYVFASKAGADSHPDWYRNLSANPEVRVEVGTETYDAIASALEESERHRIYDIQVGVFPGFGEYREKTTRVIPVVELVRHSPYDATGTIENVPPELARPSPLPAVLAARSPL